MLKVRIFGDLILCACLGYLGLAVSFPTALANVILLVIAIFVLFQACGNIDKANHFGKYHEEHAENNEEEATEAK